jgi:hypothetical protein
MCVTISSSRSVSSVKRMKVSTGMATDTRSVRSWVSLDAGSGAVYDAWSKGDSGSP